MALFDWIPRFDPRKALPSSTGTSGTPVVLLHGAYSTPKAFGALAVALNEIGRPFIAPIMRIMVRARLSTVFGT